LEELFVHKRPISKTATNILQKRYFQEGETKWEDIVDRVINHVIPNADKKQKETTRQMILETYFVPNSPCLVNSGKPNSGLAACFVVDFPDNIEGIYKTKLDFALIARKGGGCGTSLTKIRPEGARVAGSTHGYAGGGVKFANTISHDANALTQAGFRAMAIMFTESIYHPDIIKFIEAKHEEGKISNANISVVVDDAFMKAVENDEKYWTEFGGQKYTEYSAKAVFDLIVEGMWKNGEPGVLFKNRIDDSPYRYTGQEILATNPCSEQPLPANGMCNLGSLDLSKFYEKSKGFDWNKFDIAIRYGVRFLDSVIDVTGFPTKDIEAWSIENRAIGLGIMGYADLCLMSEVAYGSPEALNLLEQILSIVSEVATDESIKMGKELGVPKMCKKLPVPRRNITLTTVAPTGTISLISGCSSGIEPVFSEITIRNDKTGTYTFENDLGDKPYFRCAVSSNGAQEVTWEEHIDTLAAAQRHIDSGVSKCVEKGTLIPTNKGLMKIENFSNVFEDDKFENLKEHFNTSEGYRIDSHYKAGLKRATKVTFNNGATIVGASLSHKILTSDGWKRLSHLKPGDIAIGNPIVSHGEGHEPVYWEDNFRTNANRIKLPKTVTEDFAKFIGMITADGYTNLQSGYTGISCKDSEVEKTFIELCYGIFGVYPNIVIDKRNEVKSIYITSRTLAKGIEDLIGKGAYNKKVPEQILLGNEKEKLSYLAGITLDGYAIRDGLCVYGGMSENLARYIAELCRSFGYHQTYIGSKKVKGFGTEYYVVVGGFMQEKILCVESRKNRIPYEKDYFVYVSRETIESTHVSLNHPKYFALKNMRIYRKKQEYCWSKTAKELGWSTDILAYKVVKIEEVGIKEMFDIEVSDSHNYSVCGIVSHNTINFPTMTHRETIGKAVIKAWKDGCKGLAVYRNGSRSVEVLSPKNLQKDKCPVCGNELIEVDNKKKCVTCNKDTLIEKVIGAYD
jgi:ribonucleotide reductase alpha subunit